MATTVRTRREWCRVFIDLAKRAERAEDEVRQSREAARLVLGPQQRTQLSKQRRDFVGELRRITGSLGVAIAAHRADEAAPLIELFESKLRSAQDAQRLDLASLCDEEAQIVHELS